MAQVVSATPYLARVGLHSKIIELMSKTDQTVYQRLTGEVLESTQDFERIGSFAPFGLPTIRPENSRMGYDVLTQPFVRDFRPDMYTLSWSISMQASYTDVYKKLRMAPKLLTRSIMKNRDIAANKIFNLGAVAPAAGGFPTVDNATFWSAAHPLATGFDRNILATATTMSNATVENLRQGINRQLEHRDNIPFTYYGKYKIVVSPDIEMVTRRVIGANLIAGGNDNDPNQLGDIEIVMSPYLTLLNNIYLLQTEDLPNVRLSRIPLFTKSWEDNDTLSTKITTGEELLYIGTEYRGTYASLVGS